MSAAVARLFDSAYVIKIRLAATANRKALGTCHLLTNQSLVLRIALLLSRQHLFRLNERRLCESSTVPAITRRGWSSGGLTVGMRFQKPIPMCFWLLAAGGPWYSAYNSALPGVLGTGMSSRMFFIP